MEHFCVSCDMFVREEPPPEKDDSPSGQAQAVESQRQNIPTPAVQPSSADPSCSILDRQHAVAQELSFSLLDKMLNISKDVATARTAAECEQQLALLRSCISTYQSVAEELM